MVRCVVGQRGGEGGGEMMLAMMMRRRRGAKQALMICACLSVFMREYYYVDLETLVFACRGGATMHWPSTQGSCREGGRLEALLCSMIMT